MQIKDLHRKALKAIHEKDYSTAHQNCLNILSIEPSHADAYFLLGIINSEVGQFYKACKLISKAIGIKKQSEYFVYLAKCLSLIGDMVAALNALKSVHLSEIDQANLLDTAGVAYSRIGIHKEAIAFFAKALEIESHNPQYLYNFAVSCKFDGQFEQAEQAFEKAIAINPLYYSAHFALADLSRPDPKQVRLERLNSLVGAKKAIDDSLFLNHARAKEFELHGQYQDAFQSLSDAKASKLKSLDYKFEDDKALFEQVISLFDLPAAEGNQSSRPIFVIGMPRSGTTLVERILSNHSEVASGGELQDFGISVKELSGIHTQTVLDVETLKASRKIPPNLLGERYIERTSIVASETRHFVDKLPFNFFYIPLIRRALPNAKIVCVMRDPMDTCVGNFRQLFSVASPYYRYAYDLLNIGKFYAEFNNLVNEYRRVEDNNFYVLDYQKLVTNPKKQIETLLTFCELPWQEACLHAEKNTAPVSTASKVQVREPINTKSLGKWKRYDPLTRPLYDYLQSKKIVPL